MTRPGRWERFVGEYVGNAQSLPGHEILIATLAPGETITRIRFRWQAQHASGFAGHGAGFVVAAGIINLPLTGTFPVPDPVDFPNDPWMWWVGQIFETVVCFEDTGGTITNLDVAPARVQEVDVKAQRTASPAGDGVYFTTGTTSLSPTQSDHYCSITSSCYILEAP